MIDGGADDRDGGDLGRRRPRKTEDEQASKGAREIDRLARSCRLTLKERQGSVKRVTLN